MSTARAGSARGFSLVVENFGPVSRQSVLSLSPYTFSLWVGPSGSGKTYIAKLIYSLTRLASETRTLEAYDPRTQLVHVLSIVFGSYASKLLEDAVFSVRGCGVSLEVRRGDVRLNIDKTRVRDIMEEDSRIVEALRACTTDVAFLVHGSVEKCGETVQRLWRDAIVNELLFCSLVEYTPDERLKLPLHPHSFFLSFGRGVATLMLSEKNFDVMEVLSRLSHGPLRVVLTEAVRLLYSVEGSLVELLAREDSVLAKLVRALLLGGDVAVERRPGYRITYTKNGLSLDMASSAAAVVENTAIAALALLASSSWKYRGILFIEEPETQLHPELQRLLVWLLMYLTGKGLTIVATTHSPILAAETRIALLVSRRRDHELAREVLGRLGVSLTPEEARRLINAIAEVKLKPVYFTGTSFHEQELEEFMKTTPSIMESIEEQLEILWSLLEVE